MRGVIAFIKDLELNDLGAMGVLKDPTGEIEVNTCVASERGARCAREGRQVSNCEERPERVRMAGSGQARSSKCKWRASEEPLRSHWIALAWATHTGRGP